jgi:hypothetical protein
MAPLWVAPPYRRPAPLSSRLAIGYNHGRPTMSSTIRIEGNLRNLLVMDALAFLVCTAVLVLLYRVPLLLSPLSLSLLLGSAAALLAADIAVWIRGGVHAIELGPSTLTLYRGRDLKPHKVERESIRRLRIVRRLGRRSVIIGIGSARPIRIREDPFRSTDFRRFTAALEGWK